MTSPPPTFLRAFLTGLAAPVMVFRDAPRYVLLRPEEANAGAWRSVADHMSEAFDERHR